MMAVWQMDFFLIKKDNIKFYDESKPWGDDKNENLLSWHSSEINPESIQIISRSLLPSKSWSDKTTQFGKIEESCLEIMTFADDICQLFIRLDIRNLSRELLYEIVCFIRVNHGYIVYNNKCYLADEETMLKLIKESNAYKFCKDPVGFLTSLKNRKTLN